MDISSAVHSLRQGKSVAFPPEAKTQEFAEKLDAQDEIRQLRDEFILPTKGSLKKTALTCK